VASEGVKPGCKKKKHPGLCREFLGAHGRRAGHRTKGRSKKEKKNAFLADREKQQNQIKLMSGVWFLQEIEKTTHEENTM